MEVLQEFFKDLVEMELFKIDEEIKYENIDIFAFLKILQTDIEYKRYILKREVDYIIINYYKHLTTTDNLLEKLIKKYKILITAYLENESLPKQKLNKFVYYILVILIIYNNYINYYKKNNFNKTVSTTQQFFNDNCILNGNINEIFGEFINDIIKMKFDE